MQPILKIESLGKTYPGGHVALRDVNLEIRRGEILALLGPNGAGKTTLIGIVCGLVNASSGRVTVDGHDIARAPRAARAVIGLVPQELATEAFETVRAAVAFSRGLFGHAPDDARVDASLLLPIIRGGIDADDPRSIATVEAIRAELASDGFMYRFRHDARPLHTAEGAFLLCGFWMALIEHAYGHPVAAAHWFERNRSATGPAALYTEEFDVHQRQLRGNLPQAFVHAGMLECAVTLSRDVGLGGGG